MQLALDAAAEMGSSAAQPYSFSDFTKDLERKLFSKTKIDDRYNHLGSCPKDLLRAIHDYGTKKKWKSLSAAELAESLSMSAGAVSMTLAELQRWGVVRRVWKPGERREFFEAETDFCPTSSGNTAMDMGSSTAPTTWKRPLGARVSM